MVNIDGSTIDMCHCDARVIVSHTWACARWQVTIECISIAEVFPFVFFDVFDGLSAYACFMDSPGFVRVFL